MFTQYWNVKDHLYRTLHHIHHRINLLRGLITIQVPILLSDTSLSSLQCLLEPVESYTHTFPSNCTYTQAIYRLKARSRCFSYSLPKKDRFWTLSWCDNYPLDPHIMLTFIFIYSSQITSHLICTFFIQVPMISCPISC